MNCATRALAVFLCAGHMACTPPPQIVDAPATDAPDTPDPVAVQLIVDRTQYLTGEAAIADIVLTNISDQTVRVWPPELTPEADTAAIQWLRDGEQEQLCATAIEEFDPTPAVLAPGESLVNEVKLFYGGVQPAWSDHSIGLCPPANGRHSLGPAGVYDMRVKVKVALDGSGTFQRFTSTSTAITVTAPAGNDLTAWQQVLDAAANFDREHEPYLLMYWESGDQLVQGIAAWESVRADFAGSTYYPYSVFIRGRRFADSFLSRLADPSIAIPMLEESLTLFAPTEAIYRRKIYVWLLRAYLFDNRTDAGLALHAQMQAELGDNPRHQRYLQVAQDMIDTL